MEMSFGRIGKMEYWNFGIMECRIIVKEFAG